MGHNNHCSGDNQLRPGAGLRQLASTVYLRICACFRESSHLKARIYRPRAHIARFGQRKVCVATLLFAYATLAKPTPGLTLACHREG